MSLLLFFQQDALTPVTVAIISGCAAIVIAAISVGGTWLVMRGKNRGDFVKSLIESLDILTRRVNANTQEMDAAQGTISQLESNAKQEGRIADLSEKKIEEQRQTIAAFIEDARSIHEHIAGMSFVTTGPPTPDDERVIWRLKMMKEITARMMTQVEN